MGISNHAREQTAFRLGSNVDNLGSGFIAIGSASGALTVNTTGLLHYFDTADLSDGRNQVTGGSVDFATAQEMTMTVDFNSVQMSGLVLRQFGTFIENSGGRAWFVENTADQTFDGNQELQINFTLRTF